MKKTTSILLTLILFFSIITLPCAAVSGSRQTAPAKVTGLTITTANKKRLLKLTWDWQSDVDGYQIYRSTTGKAGSYQKIATIKNQTVYVDKGLKSATTYFYKVRAFIQMNQKNLFSSFTKANLSTKLTNKYVETYIKKANDVYNKWIYSRDGGGLDYNKKITLRHNSMEMDYYLIKDKKIKSIADIEKIVGQYFDPSLIHDEYTFYQPYYEQNGHVYAMECGVGTTFMDFDTFHIKSSTDKKTIVTDRYVDFFGDSDNPGALSYFNKDVKLIYVENHWRIQGDFYNAA